jgi:antirestriction protein ArdC
MSTIDSNATDKADVYRKVTDAIITAIETGVGNWRMPWHTSGKFAFSPINVTSHKPYRGINTLCLWAAAQAKGYERGEWATYQQWHDKGAQVRKGEKATTVVFWKFANNAAESEDGDESPKSGSRLLFTRGYSVFNGAQVDGYTPKAEPDMPIEQRIESAEQFFPRIDARVAHSIHPLMTPSPCRRLPRSLHRWITTALGHMKAATGLRTRRDVIGNWGNDSATTLTASKNL